MSLLFGGCCFGNRQRRLRSHHATMTGDPPHVPSGIVEWDISGERGSCVTLTVFGLRGHRMRYKRPGLSGLGVSELGPGTWVFALGGYPDHAECWCRSRGPTHPSDQREYTCPDSVTMRHEGG